jgi:glycosyltransferase involved in cell wall biosynthesis
MIALFASKISGVPYSLTLHGRIGDYGPGQDVKWRHAAFGTTVTQTLKRELLAAVPGLDGTKIGVAAMGVDTVTFTRRAAYAPAKAGDVVRLVSCGRLHPGKGHGRLIEAVALLKRGGVRAELRILGEGPARGELEALARSSGVQDAVELPGAKSEEVVRETLEASHVFALASRDEAIGVATMEAMCMALPVVVTDVGGVGELVRNSVDGLLVAPEDAAGIASAVSSLVSDPALAAAMGSAGAARIRERFHSGVSAAALAERLREPLAAGAGGVEAPR